MPPEQDADLPITPNRPTRYALATLLPLGLLLFALNFDPDRTPCYLVALATAAVIALLPPLRQRAADLLDRLRTPSSRQKWLTFAILFLLSSCYLALSATLAGRGLFPMYHDEHMFLLQARMLSAGRLWMPPLPHELAPFLDSFYILTSPVYAATYFPGTALLYVPGVWLHAPAWITSVVITSLAVAMLYTVMTDLLDGVAGLLAATAALALTYLRVLSTMAESYPPMLLLLLLATGSYLRWRHTRHPAWAAAFGLFAGWSAITRPLDAVCLVGPLCLLLAWDALRPAPPPSPDAPARRPRLTTALATLTPALIAAAPFLLLQLTFDQHVTGHLLQTPYTQYVHANFPDLNFGHTVRNPPADSPSPLPQVRYLYREFFRPPLLRHGRVPFPHLWLTERLAPAADAALPAHAFYALLPLGLLALLHRRRAALAIGVLTFPLAYAFYPSYIRYYGIVCTPAFLTLALGGELLLRRSLPRTIQAVLPIALAALCVASLPELLGHRDPFKDAPLLADVNARLAHLDHLPAVVLFHYDPDGSDVHQEPVYNLSTPDPTDAPILRAHDLGPAADRRLFAYFAEHQPDRFFYLYDRTTNQLTPLGSARDLAALPAPQH